jgi:hypothetical protein
MAHWRLIHRSRAFGHGLGLVAVLALCGCEDIDWDWERRAWTQTRRPIRPSRRRAPPDYRADRPRIRTEFPPESDQDRTADAFSGETRGTSRDAPRHDSSPGPGERGDGRKWDFSKLFSRTEPTRSDRRGPDVTTGDRSYHHLYLVSGQVSLKAPPNSKKIRLDQARSRAAIGVLNLIYPSIGPSGAEGKRFLVYQHKPMWAAAAEFAPLLDCPEQADLPPADPTDPMAAFQAGVGLFYRLKKPGQPTHFEGFKRCERLMTAAFGSDEATGQLRWGAAMLAGRIASQTLSEFGRARKHFELAKGLALPGSVEEMIAVYCLADTSVHQGQQDRAVRLAQGLVNQFAGHRASHVYERASALAQPR